MVLAMDIGKGTGPKYISKGGNRLHKHSIKIIENLGYEKKFLYNKNTEKFPRLQYFRKD